MKRALFLIILALATPLAAHDITAGNLQIDHSWIPRPIVTVKTAVGYMGNPSRGAKAFERVEIRTDFAVRGMLHATEHADGTARRTQVVGLSIAPGEIVTRPPDRMHAMVIDLEAGVAKGDLVSATRVFRQAGDVEVAFAVDAVNGRDPGGPSDHSGH